MHRSRQGSPLLLPRIWLRVPVSGARFQLMSSLKGRGSVIPEGAGFCQDVGDRGFCWLSASARTASGKGRGSRRSARSVARTNGLDAGPCRCMLSVDAGRSVAWCLVVGPSPKQWWCRYVGAGRTVPAAGHPFAQLWWAWSGAVATRGVNQEGDHADWGVRHESDRARVARSAHAALSRSSARIWPSRSPSRPA